MRVRLAIIAGCAAAFGAGFVTLRTVRPAETRGVFPTRPPTPFVRFAPEGPPLGRVLALHGVGAGKAMMRHTAMAMADGGFDVHLVDLPGHGDSPGSLSSSAALGVVEQLVETLGAGTILVGHSMGGGFLVEHAAGRDVGTLVLYSPGPVPVDEVRAERVLVVSGRFDSPRIDDGIPRVIDAVTGAAMWWRDPWGAHSTALFSARRLRAVVRWMGGRDDAVATGRRMGALALMTLAASVLPFAWPFAGRDGATDRLPATPRIGSGIVQYVFAGAAAVAVVHFLRPLEWLGVFGTDYLLGVILIAGLLLWRGRGFALSRRGLAAAAAAAAYVIVVFGVLIASSFVDVMPTGTQWLRVPVLAAAAFPLFLHDEQTLAGISGAARRWGAFLATRGLLWPIVVTGVLLLDRSETLLVLTMHLVLCFWLVLASMSAFVARKTGEPAAAALFATLVQAWVFAALWVRSP